MQDKGTQAAQQVETTRPPDYAIPYIGAGLENAMGMLQSGGPQQYQGQTVVPFSQQTNQALNMQQQRALQGSPLVDQAQQTTQQLMQGGQNPYLDATFNRAAGAVNRNMDSVLSRSGRDLTGNIGARADQLGNLATNIYGGAYEADQNRRLAATSQAVPLANQDYFDIGQLGNVGARVEDLTGRYMQDAMNRFNFEQQRPEAALDAYLSRTMGGNYGSQSSAPIYRNPMGSALGGAAAGAALGMQLFPGWGAIPGALLGGLAGYGG